jgi:hypothetical protein
LTNEVTVAESRHRDNRIAAGFLTDLLSDEHGISFHRFQFLAWTVVIIVVFLQQVWQRLSMPVLDEYMLTLMGMSAGAYVGMKTTEAIVAKPPASP